MGRHPEGPTRVLIADDHPMVREGLREALVSAGLEVAGEAGDGDRALHLADLLCPDVMVLDLGLPGMNGLAVMAAMKQRCLASRVVVLAPDGNLVALVRAIVYGALAYLPKSVAPEELVAAVRSAARGESLLTIPRLRSVIDRLIENDTRTAPLTGAPMRLLTPRELQVLALMGQGLSNPRIAGTLRVSPSTVKTHIEHIFSKLEVRDRTQAAVWAVRAGLTGR